MIRGKVTSRIGQPQSGVVVTVAGHPEYGQTQTRGNGYFDIAVNGGGALTVDYRQAGFLPAQRTTPALIQRYNLVDDLALTRLDTAVTALDLTDSTPFQVARGTEQTDSDVALPNGHDLHYLIDGSGRRAGKQVDGALVQGFVYQDGARPIAELSGKGAVVSRFVYAAGGLAPDYMVKAGDTYRLVKDHTGSVRLVVNSTTGAVAQRLDYDAFGRVTNDTAPGFQPFGFRGGLYDRDSGLVHFLQRDYDPDTGRLLARRPEGFTGSTTNLYTLTNPLGD